MDLYQELFGIGYAAPSLQEEEEGTLEDIQDKTNFKLQELFSFYNEQEFLDTLSPQ